MNFTVCIPTYNREAEVLSCIEAILTSSRLPNTILIVDDGALPSLFIDAVTSLAREKLVGLVYVKKDHSIVRRGLAESKNMLPQLVHDDIFFVLDDDVFVDRLFFERIMMVWESAFDDRLIGVGGVIANNRQKRIWERLFHMCFFLHSPYVWDVTSVGFQVWDDGITVRQKGYYTHGGVVSLRRDIMLDMKFSVFSGGRTGLEDVDFCLRAKQAGYYFFVEPSARVIHAVSDTGRENSYLSGLKESINRCNIFTTQCRQGVGMRLWFVWSSVGWILRQFLVLHIWKGLGMCVGIFKRRI